MKISPYARSPYVKGDLFDANLVIVKRRWWHRWFPSIHRTTGFTPLIYWGGKIVYVTRQIVHWDWTEMVLETGRRPPSDIDVRYEYTAETLATSHVRFTSNPGPLDLGEVHAEAAPGKATFSIGPQQVSLGLKETQKLRSWLNHAIPHIEFGDQ